MKRKLALGLAVVVLLSFGLAACNTPAGRSAGDVVDDSTITTKVKTKLLADKGMSGFGISVETFEGAVTLTGAVDTEAQREKAVSITRSVDGVKKVNNLLQLKK